MTGSKEKLRQLANEIKALLEHERVLKQQFKQQFPSTVSFELGDWFVAAVENYLSGTKDFSKALGLKRGPGRPKPPPSGKVYERSKKIFLMRRSGKSWLKVAAEFPKPNLRELQRELKRYQPDIIAENTRGLIAGLKHRRRPSGNK